MNKYIAGLFKNIRTTKFRIRIAVAATGIKDGVYEIVILDSNGLF